MKITVIGHGVVDVSSGSTYAELADRFPDRRYAAAKVGNVLKELHSVIEDDVKEITFLGLDTPDGEKIYQRSLIFLLIRSAHKALENVKVKVSHSLSKGVYCMITKGARPITHEECEEIKQQMHLYIRSDLPFAYSVMTKDESEVILKRQKMDSKRRLFKFRDGEEVRLYHLDGLYDYFYGYMLPSTSKITDFELFKYGEGVILMHPTMYSPDRVPEFEETPKIAEMFDEMEDWLKIMGISYISNLNERIKKNQHKEMIHIAEALQEKKIAQIADDITRLKKKVILIAGPSSSGKTTFANRLRIQLRVNGLSPITIGTDNYFVNREFTPRDENGDYDFESLDAVDVALFNEDLNKLLDGEEILVPRFDFHKGERYYTGEKLKIGENQPIIIEGIHGLNDRLTSGVFKRDKYKIYISALTQLNIDEHNRIPTTQARMLRRIVRDNQFRGHSAQRTISMWQSVRRGEEKYIFPFQEQADAIFNSALPYELAILKKHALPILEAITVEEPEYAQAKLLIKFLKYFESIEDDVLVPPISILKEFIGGSAFQ